MRQHDFDHFDDVHERLVRRKPRRRDFDDDRDLPAPDDADRWSTWNSAQQGPLPLPDWVVTDPAATDTELGVLKSGKEADVHLILRGSADGADDCLLAAKRYRDSRHRMFHRDAGYLEGRRVRRSRANRAMGNRTTFGRDLIAQQWAAAEFAALGRLWTAGVPVPYPVQLAETELLLEFVGDRDGRAAPRLAELRLRPEQLCRLWYQLAAALESMASEGFCHGDLSAYNVLVHKGRIVLIDLPQVVDMVRNPGGVGFLERDVRNIASWFTARGVPADIVAADTLARDLRRAAGLP